MICLSFLYTGRSKNPYNSDWSFVRTEGGILSEKTRKNIGGSN